MMCSDWINVPFTFLVPIKKKVDFIKSDIDLTKPFIQQWLTCPSSPVTQKCGFRERENFLSSLIRKLFKCTATIFI